MSGFLSCWQLVSETTNEVGQNKEISASENVIDPSEQEIIATGIASFGTHAVSGKACLITKRKELKKVCKGDIIITPAIHSTWYPELSLAGAIIIEKGDDAGHAISLGKKLDIPVIVGASGITKNIVDGQIITCDPITRNIYHVAYPDHMRRFRFDVLTLSEKSKDYQSLLRDKIEKSAIHTSKASMQTKDGFLPSAAENRGIISNTHRKRITKDVYLSHFNRFKKFVLGEKSQFGWTKWVGGIKAVEAGAKSFGGCDDFAVECISVGEPFFDSDDEHFVETLYDNGQSEECIEHIDSLIDECSKKPGDLNHAAYVSHKFLVNRTAPDDLNKEYLIAHPKEYRKIQHRVDNAKREALIAAGLFARYWIKNKLPL